MAKKTTLKITIKCPVAHNGRIIPVYRDDVDAGEGVRVVDVNSHDDNFTVAVSNGAIVNSVNYKQTVTEELLFSDDWKSSLSYIPEGSNIQVSYESDGSNMPWKVENNVLYTNREFFGLVSVKYTARLTQIQLKVNNTFSINFFSDNLSVRQPTSYINLFSDEPEIDRKTYTGKVILDDIVTSKLRSDKAVYVYDNAVGRLIEGATVWYTSNEYSDTILSKTTNANGRVMLPSLANIVGITHDNYQPNI